LVPGGPAETSWVILSGMRNVLPVLVSQRPLFAFLPDAGTSGDKLRHRQLLPLALDEQVEKTALYRRMHSVFLWNEFWKESKLPPGWPSSNEDNTRTGKQGPLALEVIQVHRWEGYAEVC
jgi:hypothetical protein